MKDCDSATLQGLIAGPRARAAHGSLLLVALAALAMTAGCAAPGVSRQGQSPPKHGQATPRVDSEMTLWRLSELARVDQPAILLRSPQGIHGAMDTSMARKIQAIADRLLRTHDEVPKPELAILGSGAVNAFAFYNDGQPTIAISQGMVRLLADDDDAWAALIGHELAHLRLEHLKKQIDRRQRTDVASSLAGAVLSAFGLPFASIATDATAVLATRAYSRDDEREADRAGLDYMRKAGFAADGAIRLQRQLLAASSGSGMPFLSTHPGGEERIENLRQLMHSGN